MNEHPDQYPERVKAILMRIIKPKAVSMSESCYLKEIADGDKGSTIVGIGFVPVYTVTVSPD
jgi:hypothetical protein